MKVRTSVQRGFALLALSSLTFAACDRKTTTAPPPPVITVTVAPNVVPALQVGQSTSLAAAVSGTTNQAVTWESGNPSVATVNAAGVVTGVAPGVAGIVAISQADPTARGTASVTVVAAPVDPITLQIVPSTAPVQIGGTVQLVGIVGGSTNQTVNWLSRSPAVATVGATTGLVTGVTAGTAVIEGRPAANPNVVQTAVITVTTGPPPTPVTISITPTSATTAIGDTVRFVANVQGPPGVNTAVTWTSQSPGIATVDAAGNAVGVAAGTAVIRATSVADPTRSVDATLVVTAAPPPPPPPSISIASVTTPAGASINPLAVAGQINATVNVSAVPANEVRSVALEIVHPDGSATEVCRQDFTPALGTTQSVATINCPINTAAIDAEGRAIFPNQNYQIRAVAFTLPGGRAGGGAQVAEALFCPQGQPPAGQCIVTFVNADFLTIQIIPTGTSAQDTLGRTWWRSFNVVATPTLFTPGDASVNVTVTATGFNTPVVRTVTEATPAFGPHTVQFVATGTGANSLAGVEDSIFIAAQTQRQLPLGQNPIFGNPNVPTVGFWIRIDNLAPRVLEVSLTNPTAVLPHAQYINDQRTFSVGNLCPVTGGVLRTAHCEVQTIDRGVDRQYEANRVTYDIVTPTAAGLSTPVAGGANVTNTSGVAESATNMAYALRVTIRDALGNERAYFPVQGTFTYNEPQTTAALPCVGPGCAVNPVSTQVLPALVGDAIAMGFAAAGTAQGTWNNTLVANVRRFGVDRTPPEQTIVSGPAHMTTWNANTGAPGPWTLLAVDVATPPAGPSGFGPNANFVRLVRYNAADPNGRCINPNTGASISTNLNAAACFVAFGNPATVGTAMAATNGYYVMTTFAQDAALNQSAQVSRTILWDNTAPVVGGLTTPSVIFGGQPATFFAQLTDNVDLGDVWTSTGYFGGSGNIWLVQNVDVLSTWGLPVVTNVGHTATIPQFIRSIVQTDGGGAPQGPAARSVATMAEMAVRDMAGMTLGDMCPLPGAGDDAAAFNCRLRQATIASAVNLGVTGPGGTAYRNWTVFAAGQTINMFALTAPTFPFTMCNGQVDPAPQPQPCPSGDPTSTLVTASVTGTFQVFNNPFQRVLFYLQPAAAGPRAHLIGQGAVGVFDDTQTNIRTWTYTVNFSAVGWAPGTYQIFAVGVDANGDALMTQLGVIVINID
jgi:uncharacterized protein YjdB